ncbi:MAG: hypothetical protein E6J09_00680, partial [Chloroflexi bacterium]
MLGPITDQIDLWAPVSRDGLPSALVDAMKRRDWESVRNELGMVMDGITTDGTFGRALLQLALELPVGVDPVFDSYKAAASIDHGDWDVLRRSIEGGSAWSEQFLGMRDIPLGPLDQIEVPRRSTRHYAMLFGGYEYEFSQLARRFRRWAREMLSFQATELVWARADVPAGRHFRQRRLQDEMMLAIAEVHAGHLQTAMALALEASHLGDETEPLRLIAPDLEDLVALAMGDDRQPSMRYLVQLAKPTGLSPLGAWQMLVHLMPLV